MKPYKESNLRIIRDKRAQNRLALGRYLKKARLKAGHTQVQVADAIGRLPMYISEVERGNRGSFMSPYVAFRWADFLGIDPKIVFGYLGIEGTQEDVVKFLEQTMWGNRVIEADRLCKTVLRMLSEIPSNDVTPGVMDTLIEAKTLIKRNISQLNVSVTET